MDKFTEEYIENIRNIIAENNAEQAQEILKGLHPADIAELYQNLDLEEADSFINYSTRKRRPMYDGTR